MDSLLSQFAEGSWVILDGLAMSAMPDILLKHAQRLHLVALVHHPLADETGLSQSERDWFFEREKGIANRSGRFHHKRIYRLPAG